MSTHSLMALLGVICMAGCTQEPRTEPGNVYLGIKPVPTVAKGDDGVSSEVAKIMVAQNSPASFAGLKSGDIIFGIDGISVTDMDEVVSELVKIRTPTRISVIRSSAPDGLDILVAPWVLADGEVPRAPGRLVYMPEE